MINKKIIKITNVSEFGQNIILFGEFSYDKIQKMVNIAEKHNMACLAFIDIKNFTFFNEQQCETIKNELKILDSCEGLDKNLLQTLFAAAETSIKSSDYIKIEGYGEQTL